MAAKQSTFEEKLSKLEALVQTMEAGGLSLDATLKNYEAGVRLARELTKELEGAEKKMLELKGQTAAEMEDAP